MHIPLTRLRQIGTIVGNMNSTELLHGLSWMAEESVEPTVEQFVERVGAEAKDHLLDANLIEIVSNAAGADCVRLTPMAEPLVRPAGDGDKDPTMVALGHGLRALLAADDESAT